MQFSLAQITNKPGTVNATAMYDPPQDNARDRAPEPSTRAMTLLDFAGLASSDIARRDG
jgi:hypothetical protein